MPHFPPIVGFTISALIWAGIWCVAFMGLARASGWHTLAKYYQYHGPMKNRNFWHRTILMRYRLSYELNTHIKVTNEGLYICLFFLFRPGHPKLFFPWSDITVNREKWLCFRYFVYRFKEAPHIKMRMYESLGKKVAELAGEKWPGIK